jgi:hypothetical protein
MEKGFFLKKAIKIYYQKEGILKKKRLGISECVIIFWELCSSRYGDA